MLLYLFFVNGQMGRMKHFHCFRVIWLRCIDLHCVGWCNLTCNKMDVTIFQQNSRLNRRKWFAVYWQGSFYCKACAYICSNDNETPLICFLESHQIMFHSALAKKPVSNMYQHIRYSYLISLRHARHYWQTDKSYLSAWRYCIWLHLSVPCTCLFTKKWCNHAIFKLKVHNLWLCLL